jgi:hypothetical protein
LMTAGVYTLSGIIYHSRIRVDLSKRKD